MENTMTEKNIYITIDWQEQNIIDDTNRRKVWNKEREVCFSHNYPQLLPCNNPKCKNGGGFEIGERIRNLLASGNDSEQNSLICRNAIHPDRDKRCLHTIIYTIVCIRPYQRERPQIAVADQTA